MTTIRTPTLSGDTLHLRLRFQFFTSLNLAWESNEEEFTILRVLCSVVSRLSLRRDFHFFSFRIVKSYVKIIMWVVSSWVWRCSVQSLPLYQTMQHAIKKKCLINTIVNCVLILSSANAISSSPGARWASNVMQFCALRAFDWIAITIFPNEIPQNRPYFSFYLLGTHQRALKEDQFSHFYL